MKSTMLNGERIEAVPAIPSEYEAARLELEGYDREAEHWLVHKLLQITANEEAKMKQAAARANVLRKMTDRMK